MEPARVAKTSPRPFVKWAGGKQALARRLACSFPRDFERYVEPFVGGGSVLLEVGASRAVAGDLNDWLLDTYEAIRLDWARVADALDRLPNTREDYLRVRNVPPSTLDLFDRAALFVYLNKTGFRGLFRVNREGRFNVPYGAYDRRTYDPENLHGVAAALEHVEFRRGDFVACLHDVTEDDFVYMDPPYYKLGGHSDFNRYTPGQFRAEDHERLAALCRNLDRRGVRWAVSNSDTPFVRDLFAGFRFETVDARREINLKAAKRAVGELLIRNT